MRTKNAHELTPEALLLVAERFRVLAEAQRLRILQILRHGERNVSELTERLATTQPNASKHLRLLQEAGLIGRRQAGTSVYYFVTDPSVFALCDVVCTSLYERMSAHARTLRGAAAAASSREKRKAIRTRA